MGTSSRWGAGVPRSYAEWGSDQPPFRAVLPRGRTRYGPVVGDLAATHETTVASDADRAPAISTVRVIEVSALADHAPAWDALVATSALPTPFMLSWWLEQVRPAAGARYVLVIDERRLIGGIGIQVDRWAGLRRVRLLGDGPLAPDHLDVLAAAGREAEVVGAFATWLRGQGRCLVDLRGVADRALLLKAMPAVAGRTPISAAPYLTLDGPTTAAERRPSRRRNTQAMGRRLMREGVTYRVVVEGAPDFDRALADLRARHVERWTDQSSFASAFPTFARAARAGFAAGAVQVHELVVGGEVIATMVMFDAGKRRCFYQGGRATDHRWRGAGNVLLHEVIVRSQRHGLAEFDFLRGSEPYKYDWTSLERPVLRVRSAVGLLPTIVTMLLMAMDRARPFARRLKARARRRRVRTPRRGG